MGFVKNYQQLATNNNRRVLLELVEAAFYSIQPEEVFRENLSIVKSFLKVKDKTFDLSGFGRVFILGFGKGSAKNSLFLEKALGEKLTKGFVIDVMREEFSKIEFTLGTHPLPSQANIDFTKNVIEKLGSLGENDLVLVVTCGGGSVMLEAPHGLNLAEMIAVNQALLLCGASIQEINAVRKHLDAVKGGGLAKILFPARVVNLIFSDVPGNDFSVIASGPTVIDSTDIRGAKDVINKYGLMEKLGPMEKNFIESPKEERYFKNVENILFLSNDTALLAMQRKAQKLGYRARILTNSFQGDANSAGQKLIEGTKPKSILLVGGETDVKVSGTGTGGSNMHLVLAALPDIDDNTAIVSFDSDGWDNIEAAGAIGDVDTLRKAISAGLDFRKFLEENNSLAFFKAVGDAILTGRLPSNVSDLMVVLKD